MRRRRTLVERWDPDGSLREYSQQQGLMRMYEVTLEALKAEDRARKQSRKDLGLLMPMLCLQLFAVRWIGDALLSLGATLLIWAAMEALRHSSWWRVKE